ncbi:MAG TPA: hypothetical protein VFL56_06855 [Solirubrobacterales bacterium]|nr:hypothetical protein [Solirubrobacterales bacterium]
MTDTEKPGPGGERAPAAGRPEIALEERRMDMKSAEGHAGSVPRGNPEREEDHVGHLRDAYERVLGH